MARLTEATARNMKAGSARKEVPEGIVTGLYLVVQPSGVKSWAFRYRSHGRPKKITFGKYSAITLAAAREMGRETLLAVAKGDDPERRPSSLSKLPLPNRLAIRWQE